jgi:chloramphenicol 3-O-phosphotransferase
MMQLLERATALASLAGYAREARRGDGRLVLLTGEAGVGKSALVEQLQNDLPDACWSWGACDGLFTPARSGRCSTWRCGHRRSLNRWVR